MNWCTNARRYSSQKTESQKLREIFARKVKQSTIKFTKHEMEDLPMSQDILTVLNLSQRKKGYSKKASSENRVTHIGTMERTKGDIRWISGRARYVDLSPKISKSYKKYGRRSLICHRQLSLAKYSGIVNDRVEAVKLMSENLKTPAYFADESEYEMESIKLRREKSLSQPTNSFKTPQSQLIRNKVDDSDFEFGGPSRVVNNNRFENFSSKKSSSWKAKRKEMTEKCLKDVVKSKGREQKCSAPVFLKSSTNNQCSESISVHGDHRMNLKGKANTQKETNGKCTKQSVGAQEVFVENIQPIKPLESKGGEVLKKSSREEIDTFMDFSKECSSSTADSTKNRCVDSTSISADSLKAPEGRPISSKSIESSIRHKEVSRGMPDFPVEKIQSIKPWDIKTGEASKANSKDSCQNVDINESISLADSTKNQCADSISLSTDSLKAPEGRPIASKSKESNMRQKVSWRTLDFLVEKIQPIKPWHIKRGEASKRNSKDSCKNVDIKESMSMAKSICDILFQDDKKCSSALQDECRWPIDVKMMTSCDDKNRGSVTQKLQSQVPVESMTSQILTKDADILAVPSVQDAATQTDLMVTEKYLWMGRFDV